MKDEYAKDSSIVYDGSADKLEMFKKQVARFGRKNFHNLSDKIVQGTVGDITDENEYDFAEETQQCLEWIDREEADKLSAKEEFYSKVWQQVWLDKQYEKLFNYLEQWTTDNAADKLEELGLSRVHEWYTTFDKEFGGGSAAAIHKDQTAFKAGLPNQNGVSWTERCNVKDKLRALEKAQQGLRQRCPLEKRATYEYAQKSMLVRIIMEHAHPIYQTALQNIKNTHKLKRELQGHESPGDVALEHYSDDWLPPYKSVHDGLIEMYELLCKTWRSDPDKTKQLPTMSITQDDSERGNGDRSFWIKRCVGCALTGHQFGASECTASPGVLHPDAPSWAKKMLDQGTLGGRGGGSKSRGTRGTGRRGGGALRAPKDNTCFQWKKTGSCRFGDRCRFTHPAGGGDASRDKDRMKSIATNVMKSALKKALSKGKKKRLKEQHALRTAGS